ncbi:hypothetical protein [Salinisphaera orenii]|uniref:hypothetical protein n=1 Tax=Salinisphaera orenii TaxID=856731 RepID=UPI0011CD548C|nr:hypothetical protein [Salinisphaera halophila]
MHQSILDNQCDGFGISEPAKNAGCKRFREERRMAFAFRSLLPPVCTASLLYQGMGYEIHRAVRPIGLPGIECAQAINAMSVSSASRVSASPRDDTLVVGIRLCGPRKLRNASVGPMRVTYAGPPAGSAGSPSMHGEIHAQCAGRH